MLPDSKLMNLIRQASAVLLCAIIPQVVSADESSSATVEVIALNAAIEAAQSYAMDREGIGIVIHVGDDIPNAHFATGEAFGAVLSKKFEDDFGIEARAFPRENPGTQSTLVTYYIGHLVHGGDNETEAKSVQNALSEMPDVVAQFRLIQELGPVLGADD